MTIAKPLDGDLGTARIDLHRSLWPARNEVWALTLLGLEDIEVVIEGIGNLPDRITKAVFFYLERDLKNVAFNNVCGGVRTRVMDLESFILNFRKTRLFYP